MANTKQTQCLTSLGFKPPLVCVRLTVYLFQVHLVEELFERRSNSNLSTGHTDYGFPEKLFTLLEAGRFLIPESLERLQKHQISEYTGTLARKSYLQEGQSVPGPMMEIRKYQQEYRRNEQTNVQW